MSPAEGLAFFVLGSGFGWAISWYFYKRNTADLQLLEKNLGAEVRDIIEQSSTRRMTIPQLRTLLDERTIDPTIDHPFPYKACPNCGSTELTRDGEYVVNYERGDDGEPIMSGTPIDSIRCNSCGCARLPEIG